MDSENNSTVTCNLCKSKDCTLILSLTQKPKQEILYGFDPENYFREIYLCNNCNVFFNKWSYDLDKLYTGDYNKEVYKNKILENYLKIRALPQGSSDNKNRVKRIVDFLRKAGLNPSDTKVLDVGSGLCVFLGELKEFGFQNYCIDPCPLSIKHALENVKVDAAHCGTLNDFNSSLTFDLITFNKILEHIKDPLQTLKKAKKYLNPNGFIYIELPDGDNAIKNGGAVDREEFYLGHYTIFNKKSINYLIESAGLCAIEVQEIHEPSGKYTIFAFAKKKI